jgi:uncharacterized membrane protein YkvI
MQVNSAPTPRQGPGWMRLLRIYFVPGAVYQSITIGGGYGTGREIVEYFTQYGIAGGFAGMAVTTLCMAVVLAATFEVARAFAVYDYRSFIAALIGPAAWLYEVLAVAMLLLVLAVVGAAAGNVLADTLGVPVWVGGLLMLSLVMVLNFFGRLVVTGALTVWAVLLTTVFLAFCAVSLSRWGGAVAEALRPVELKPGWLTSALQFSLYNVAAVPLMLYAARGIATRAQAIASGAIAAVFAIIPGVAFHLAFATAYPGIVEQSVPTYWMIRRLAMPVLFIAYIVVLFGTLVETCAGVMQGVNERIDDWYRRSTGRELGRLNHALVAGAAIVASGALSSVGIVTLIARGYGTMAWCFLVIYVIPVLTIGLWKLRGAAGAR